MSDEQSRLNVRRGVLAAVGANILWGLFPVFWKQLHGIEATELIAHRVIWSLLFVAVVCHQQRSWPELRSSFLQPRLIGLHLVSGALLTINWLSYVWAVTHDRVIEVSLGYFLVPLLNVVAGRFLLKEHLRPLQIAAVSVAAAGVAFQFTKLESIPWLALAVAGSWGSYGLLRKKSPLGSLSGLALETALYAPLAVACLVWLASQGRGALGHEGPWRTTLVLCAGVVTAVPLLLFASGARRLRFSTLGLLQYIVPTMTFSLAICVYGEAVGPGKLVSFILIWVALALYTIDARRASS